MSRTTARPTPSLLPALALASIALFPSSLFTQTPAKTITGQAAFHDYTQEHPGVRRKITLADLPEPKESESVDNGPSLVPRPPPPPRRPLPPGPRRLQGPPLCRRQGLRLRQSQRSPRNLP